MDAPQVPAGEKVTNGSGTPVQGLFHGSFDEAPGPDQMRAIRWAIVFYRTLPQSPDRKQDETHSDPDSAEGQPA